jgi:hypothetical protein
MQEKLDVMALPANTHKTVTGLLVVGVIAWLVELIGTLFLTVWSVFYMFPAYSMHYT